MRNHTHTHTHAHKRVKPSAGITLWNSTTPVLVHQKCVCEIECECEYVCMRVCVSVLRWLCDRAVLTSRVCIRVGLMASFISTARAPLTPWKTDTQTGILGTS